MIINFLNRHSKAIAWCLYGLFYGEWLLAAETRNGHFYRGSVTDPGHYTHMALANAFAGVGKAEEDRPVISMPGVGEKKGRPSSIRPITGAAKKAFGGGPSQPEMQAFQSVNANNMVDLFSGDFSYNIPLMDVGGYPVNISYRSGISMDQEASWVGLGWNVNPGTITRNLRGVPDDFNGTDSIKKTTSIKENKTIGVTGGGGGDLELTGFPIGIGVGASMGIFHNSYKGWGLENGVNVSLNAGSGSSGGLTGGLGLSVNNNSQDGLTLTPSLSISLSQHNADETSGSSGSFTTSLPYNSRTGLKGLEMSIGFRQTQCDLSNQHNFSGGISFASMAYTPTITMPLTSRQYTFTAKVGLEEYVVHPSFFVSGYVSRQGIDAADTTLSLPAYGYLHYQDGSNNKSALLDMNREKEMVYRDKPPMPHIAVPIYTYDAFSITGEGTGGMFRAYRGDIGSINDHFIRTKDASDKGSVDIGVTNLVHVGIDLNFTRSFTQNGPWVNQNSLRNTVRFKQDSGLFEAAYFRNPGEKSINSKKFYDAIGGDDVVTARLYQPGPGSSVIQATNYLTHYRGARAVGDSLLTPQKAFKTERDKRTQVISYLNATEADAAGLSRYIENYTPNVFSQSACVGGQENEEGYPLGLIGEYFPNISMKGTPYIKRGDSIGYNWGKGHPAIAVQLPLKQFPSDNFSIRWTGRIKAPVTGRYIFTTTSDDGVKFWLNDTLLINNYHDHGQTDNRDTVQLIAGELYTAKMEYYEHGGKAIIDLKWAYPGQSTAAIVPKLYLYPPAVDTFAVGNFLVKEKRINSFRKSNHISEINVLNNDGRRYVYGIPVYNLRQKEATFAVNGQQNGNILTGLTKYAHDVSNADNTAGGNHNGKDWYYNSEEIPAYAHSFLLTGILSPDYVDLTGNGISDDDLGDAVRFNYSKICGIGRPYRWRAPYVADSATYNEGLKTESRDDKGNYIYGEKELWYLHSIQSKTMIATFVTANRSDLFAVDEAGHKIVDSSAKRLKEINLYSKADFIKNGVNAIPVKTVHFEYSYALCRGANKAVDPAHQSDSGKLTLTKIWFTYNGNNKGKQNPYVFNYNALNPAYTIKSYDRWGNYKDPSQNPGSTSDDPLTNAEYPYALQDSTLASVNAAAWSLDSINLPSGGAIKVAFESDDYAYVQNRRAMDLFKLAGLGKDSILGHSSSNLYDKNGDNLYVFVTVPRAVSSKADLLQTYLFGVTKLYFKLFVRMPDDQYGSGSEYVSCYADLDQGNSYGIVNSNTIWVRIKGISLAGDADGSYSPLAKGAIQFLRLNLPSKAYAGSEPGDNIDLSAAIQMVFSMGDNLKNAFKSFDATARGKSWCMTVDFNRTFIRLDDPFYKKYGGGHRVKRITIYDKWDKMVTGQRAAVYGQEYTYTTQQEINGVTTTISSGVASYEPGIGGEENPFRQPIEYVEKIAPLGPVTLGYSEEPLGESVFPSAGVGYSKVRVRTINYKNKKSANGYEERTFYTAYDFPTYTDRSLLDDDTKKRYKPGLANFLRINAFHYLTLSQGFKVELNDMHGKLRTQAYYPETDPNNYTSYTENFYKVENSLADAKRLSNTASVIHPDGSIDTAAYIGKDVELMTDMREQLSITNGNDISVNADVFLISSIPPIMIIPSFIYMPQREEDQFRSVAILKVIQRYGILDSVIHIDKGSKVSTKDMLYDSETGDVLLTRTQNEFNDPVYNFSYPSHWAYDGMGPAYKNIDAVLQHVSIQSGKLVKGSYVADSVLFSSGDEILVAGKQQTGTTVSCVTPFSSFPDYTTIWAIDSSVLHGGASRIYFIDAAGNPYNGNDVTLKIIRSGRRNMNSMVGSVTTLQNPLVWNSTTNQYNLVLNTASGVLHAASSEFKQFWKVDDYKRHKTTVNCVDTVAADCSGGGVSCSCQCLKKLFDYLIASHRLFIKAADQVSVGSLVQDANNAGYSLAVTDCPVLQANQYKLFSAQTSDSIAYFYAATIGDFLVEWNLSEQANLYHFYSTDCGTDRAVHFVDTADIQAAVVDTVQQTLHVTQSLSYYHLVDSPVNYGIASPLPADFVDTNTTKIVAASEQIFGHLFTNNTSIYSLLKFDSISSIPSNATIQSANLYLTAYPSGFAAPTYTDAHTRSPLSDSAFEISIPNTDWSYSSYAVYPGLNYHQYYGITTPDQNLTVDAGPIVSQWMQNGNYGLLFSAFHYPLRYNTFCSQRYSDTTKRPHLDVTYTTTTPADTITGIMTLYYRQTCDTITDYSCQSVVTDTSFNPYVAGILGNWRAVRNYTYYGTRAETDPSTGTNIRHNGVFHDFASFWSFQGGRLAAQYDTTRWVWNSELTLFNRKGMEIENKDPLGRYNAIQYGYNLTLPVAVTQNGHYRESVFEGFEDYGFLTQTCDTACPAARFIDFSPYLSKLTTTQKHSGKSSLQLNAGDQAGLQFSLTDTDTAQANMVFSTSADTCSDSTVLRSIKMPKTILLPAFSPFKGRQMVLSAWVKEQQTCTCTSYTSNDIKVNCTGSAPQTLTFLPTGNIIEGWQRYEGIFTIPAGDTAISVTMEATGSTTVYFDDLRIHPFNANMKSFVYNPINLRLMAEQDENNYSTFYEYDDDGTLIRVKKETERGIQTIKETRSALLKQ